MMLLGFPSSLVRECALQSTSMPAPHRRNLPNCRLMVDGGMRKCSAGACPPQGSGWGVAESAVPIRCTKPQFRLFTPWCAGTSRHERLVLECALQSTSMPAPHRRNVPNCRLMVDGGMRKCSAGACPPLGSAWGVAESARANSLYQATIPAFHTLVCRHERLARKHAPQSTSMPAPHGRNVPNCRPMADGGMRKCSAGACPPQGSGWGVAESAAPIRCTKPQFRLFTPWCAGTSRSWAIRYESMPPNSDRGPESKGRDGEM